jgi:LysM repeat protein
MTFLYRLIGLSAFTIFFLTPLCAQRKNREEYIAKFKDIAIEQMRSHGIPASIILGQACLESSFGESRLAKEANNHFGIKCHNWQGATILHDDDSPGECFRRYSDPVESFRDHSDFLRYRERYRSLFELDPKDYKSWAYALKAAGYATNPQYATILIRIIEDYSLYIYDSYITELPPTPISIIANQEINPSQESNLYRISLTRTLYTKSGISYIIAGKNDTYSSLASEFALFKRELLGFNDLKKDIAIEDGTVVYIERKGRSGDVNLPAHVVERGETMYSISQKYAIRVERLYKINGKKRGFEPEAGDLIKLR